MKKQILVFAIAFPVIFLGFASTVSAQDTFSQMLDLSRPNRHHVLLGQLAGKWTFQDPERSYVKGTAVRTPVYDGRFYMVEITGGKLPVPIADGKMKDDNYKELHLEGYDNVQEKYVKTSINNHIGSDMEWQDGTYDSTTNTFTYLWKSALLPSKMVENKCVVKILSRSRYVEEYFEKQKDQFVKVRELDFTKVD